MAEKITLESLAGMIKRGFDETQREIDKLDKANDERLLGLQSEMKEGFKSVDDKFSQVNARLSYIERDISEIRKHFVYRDEFEDLSARVKYIELKIGIESGK
jgi:predicted nuclease with TOPRIM domain